MKKLKNEKDLEDLTHQDLVEALIFDEVIQDNLQVSNDYAQDKYGNSLITIGFDESIENKKRGASALMLFTFDVKGHLIGIEVATKKGNKNDWQVVSSEKFVDFTSRFVVDDVRSKERKKRG